MSISLNTRLAPYENGPLIDYSAMNFRAYSIALTILALPLIPSLSPWVMAAPLIGRAIDYLEAPSYDIKDQLEGDLDATAFAALIRMGVGHTIEASQSFKSVQEASEKLSTTELVRDAIRQQIVPMWSAGAAIGALLGIGLKLSSPYTLLALPAMITTVQIAALAGIILATLLMASDIYQILSMPNRSESIELIYNTQIFMPQQETT